MSRLAFPDGNDGWLLSRYDEVRALLADPRTSSRRGFALNPIQRPPEVRELPRVRPGQLLRLDPPEHTRYRRLLTGQFTVRRFPSLRLAVPITQIRMRNDTFIYGVHELPVTWDGEERSA